MQLLQQTVENLLQLTPAAFAEVYAQDVLHHCAASAVQFADANIAATLGKLVIWLQQQPQSTLSLLQDSQSDEDLNTESDSEDDDAAGAADAGLQEPTAVAAAAAAAGDDDLPLPLQLWYLCNRQLAQITWQLFMAMGGNGDKAVASITQQLVDTGERSVFRLSCLHMSSPMLLFVVLEGALAAGSGHLIVVWGEFCSACLSDVVDESDSWQLFMAMGRNGDNAVASVTQQLVDTGERMFLYVLLMSLATSCCMHDPVYFATARWWLELVVWMLLFTEVAAMVYGVWLLSSCSSAGSCSWPWGAKVTMQWQA
jgi:hypothetical protein